MTAWDRKQPGGALVASAASSAAPPRPAAEAVRSFSWEDWLRHSSAAQKATVLDLALRQGLVFVHQIPPAANGVKAAAPSLPPGVEKWKTLLAGKTDDLSPITPAPVTFVDQALDRCQGEAVGRALASPDLFLLRGLPGSGKSRVLAEILTQTALAGQRALFVAAEPVAVDIVLERIAQHPAVFALRFLDAGQASGTLSPAVWNCTYPERLRTLQNDLRQRAAQAVHEAVELQRRRQAESPLWARLADVVRTLGNIERQLRSLVQGRAQVEAAVLQEISADPAVSGPLSNSLAALQARTQEERTALQARLRAAEEERLGLMRVLEETECQRALLRPLAEAKRQGRWWTLAWWRATFGGQVLQQADELDRRREDTQRQVQESACRQEDLRQQLQQLEGRLLCERDDLMRAEIERRLQQVNDEEQSLLAQQSQQQAAWQRLNAELDPSYRPAEPSLEAIEEAQARWQQACCQVDEGCSFAQRWVEYLEGAGEQLAARLPAWANVVAGTISALSADSGFVAAARGDFDVLVIEEADTLTESEFLQLARLARRCVLVGASSSPTSQPEKSSSRIELRPAVFSKLWNTLHSDSARLHIAWQQRTTEQDAAARWCCRFRPLQEEDRKNLETETLVDYPEIELSILVTPKSPPALAEVAFPPGMSIQEAKQFIFRELQEPALDAVSQGGWLRETPDAIHFELAPGDGTVPDALIELAAGLHEAVHEGKTRFLEFGKDAGWTRTQVDQWLQRHLHLRDLGRTMFLETGYRFQENPALAQFVNCCLSQADVLKRTAAQVDFFPVPGLRKEKVNGSACFPKEGAGLEQDLAAVRLGDRLPGDVRAALPRTGTVNYLEAQALVGRLEELVRSAADQLPIAVIALQDAQAELLRWLIDRSPVLAGQAGAIEVGVPQGFRQREFDTVLVSLTRSHSHRAVAYGTRDGDLSLALTRARRQLLLFGDPGALVKRKSWRGPLDHLDAASAEREALLITRLVSMLRVVPAAPHAPASPPMRSY